AQQSELLVQVEPAQNSSWRTRFCERFLKPQFYRQIPCPVHHVTRSASLKTRSNNETIPTATTRMDTPTLTPSWMDQSINHSINPSRRLQLAMLLQPLPGYSDDTKN
ncbi:hypothetical protein KC19_12G028300, partial [Ceratodon purpureus]